MDEKISVLILDDEDTFREVLERELLFCGFDVSSTPDPSDAIERVTASNFDVILLDIKMPSMDGIECLKRIKEIRPMTEVIMLTGFGSIENAIASMKLGAYDFLTKPCKLDELEALIRKAGEKRKLLQENIAVKRSLKKDGHEIIGQSSAMRKIMEMIERISQSDSTVLICGESGTGKELIARGIHELSPRRERPFVVVDCASLHENLLNSELFGHEKGAFTGAFQQKYGLFEIADKGTIFLDEIGEVTLPLQGKLLRVLETGTFRRLGGTKDIKVNVRIIAATNRNLKKMVEEGSFRLDLFYRLNVITIEIPPLRERKEDIPLLVKHFLEKKSTSRSTKMVSKEAMDLLMDYHWPGNVRELENIIERACILSSDKDLITPEFLPFEIKQNKLTTAQKHTDLSLKELERKHIIEVLKLCNGNRKKAAKYLGISERSIYRKLKELSIDEKS